MELILKIPVTIIKIAQSAVPPQTIPFDCSHSPGVAKITGIPTDNAKEINIKIKISNCNIRAMRNFRSFKN